MLTLRQIEVIRAIMVTGIAENILADPRIAQLFLGGGLAQAASVS